MFIHCPNCGFSREVDKNSIPASSTFATCPKCEKRFRFRDDPGQPSRPAAEHTAQATPSPVQEEPKISGHPQPGPEEAGAPDDKDDADPIEDAAKDAPQGKNADDIWSRVEKMNEEWDKGEKKEAEEHTPGFDQEKNREDLREEAHRAYQRAAAQGRRVPLLSPGGSVAWEVPGGFGTPKGFIATLATLIKAHVRFFAGINPFSSIVPAWLFLLICYIPLFVFMALRVRNMELVVIGTQETVNFSSIVSLPELVGMLVFLLTFFHFVGTAFIYLTLRLLEPQKASFRLTFKALAYAKAPMLLIVVPIAGEWMGFFLSLVLFVLSIRYAYKLNWAKTIMALLPYILLTFMLVLQLLQVMAGGMQNMPM